MLSPTKINASCFHTPEIAIVYLHTALRVFAHQLSCIYTPDVSKTPLLSRCYVREKPP